MLSRKDKEQVTKDIAAEMQKSELIIVTDYRGLDVQAINNLRGRLKEAECLYRVTKNTMNRLACREAGFEALEELFEGPTAIAYSSADPVIVAKILLDYRKEKEALEIKGGLLSGQFLSAEQLNELGLIPPKEVLLAMVVGGFQSPIAGFANVLRGTLSSLVYAVDAVREQKESA